MKKLVALLMAVVLLMGMQAASAATMQDAVDKLAEVCQGKGDLTEVVSILQTMSTPKKGIIIRVREANLDAAKALLADYGWLRLDRNGNIISNPYDVTFQTDEYVRLWDGYEHADVDYIIYSDFEGDYAEDEKAEYQDYLDSVGVRKVFAGEATLDYQLVLLETATVAERKSVLARDSATAAVKAAFTDQRMTDALPRYVIPRFTPTSNASGSADGISLFYTLHLESIVETAAGMVSGLTTEGVIETDIVLMVYAAAGDRAFFFMPAPEDLDYYLANDMVDLLATWDVYNYPLALYEVKR